MTRASGEFAVAHGAQFPAQGLPGDLHPERLKQPLRQIDETPSYDAMTTKLQTFPGVRETSRDAVQTVPARVHPSLFEPTTLILISVLCVFGAIIGMQLLVSLGITANTSLIGALAAMALARVPLAALARYRSIHAGNDRRPNNRRYAKRRSVR